MSYPLRRMSSPWKELATRLNMHQLNIFSLIVFIIYDTLTECTTTCILFTLHEKVIIAMFPVIRYQVSTYT
jgi:hypothetical protein